MPDLSGLNAKASLTLLLNRMFAGGGPKALKSYAFVMNFIRLADKLIIEYERTRTALNEYVNTPNNVISPIIYATNNCESCITTMVRAIKLGHRIRRDQNGPTIMRKIPVLSDSVWSRVNKMRVAIEHIDDGFCGSTWVPGDPPCLLLKSDRLELIGEEILYVELADWVRQLSDLAIQLALYKESWSDHGQTAEPGTAPDHGRM
jgi:hypothetical protein